MTLEQSSARDLLDAANVERRVEWFSQFFELNSVTPKILDDGWPRRKKIRERPTHRQGRRRASHVSDRILFRRRGRRGASLPLLRFLHEPKNRFRFGERRF